MRRLGLRDTKPVAWHLMFINWQRLASKSGLSNHGDILLPPPCVPQQASPAACEPEGHNQPHLDGAGGHGSLLLRGKAEEPQGTQVYQEAHESRDHPSVTPRA